VKRLLGYPLVRLIAIVVVFGVLTALTISALKAAGVAPQSPATAPIWGTIGLSVLGVVALLVAILGIERLFAGRGPASIGFDPRVAPRDLALGVILGAILFCAVVLVLALSGAYRITAVHVSGDDLGLAVLVFGAGAAAEELLFRGALFRLIEEWAGTWVALVVSAVFFGLAHAMNPGAGVLSSAAIAIEAGVLLGAAFVVTRNLWLPIGLHFAWNLCEGPIFGAQISGMSFPLRDALSAHIVGPAWLTGGAFGPEAGVPAVVVGAIAAGALLTYAKWRALIVPARWALPAPA
jgi:membrane protease YdiL (CAAX protease family)